MTTNAAWPCTALENAEVSPEAFERPRGFDLQKYDADERFGFGEGHRIRLQFCGKHDAGFHLRGTPLSKDPQIGEVDDRWTEDTATVVDSAMLDW